MGAMQAKVMEIKRAADSNEMTPNDVTRMLDRAC